MGLQQPGAEVTLRRVGKADGREASGGVPTNQREDV
jgi:hypothetical protein